ncbi:BTAD domain-containing putative transcriptional regulator [Fodinicola acaciae]|uniref:BTAD domain-containing putative transcriptional regulator n=1 Tax=Fodinicola acaciae TaxID=2681555 RepID=UPI0013D007F0|nr:BTAD domain-containing putative transcriptional regulator [Fodinicola acaciae]
MRFGVLGPVTAWTDRGEQVAIPGAKVRALLAVLLSEEGRAVTADRLIDDLWGERAPSNPAAALAVKVSQLRRALEDAEAGGKSLVTSGPAGYALRTDAVDAYDFRDLATKAEQADDLRTKAKLLGDALALWRGGAYADVADETFAQPVIARLAEQRLAAYEEHAEVRLELGEHTALAGELGGLLASHPLRERLRAAHMRALYRAGRQTEALDSFQQLSDQLAEELGLDPSQALVALRQAILTQDASLAAPERHGNLPPARTDLIGRDAARSEILAELRKHRLVTLTGPGGVGKTGLALAVAREHGNAWLVELAGQRGRLADAALAALGVRETPGESDPLASALRHRKLLLVIDNCEHVIDEAAELVDRLLHVAPDVRVLATSREPLAVAGEVVWTVPALEEPDAARLFAARAPRDAALDQAAVAELCRRLDGLPLALELAATRVAALGVRGLLDRLDDRFRLLGGKLRGQPARQQTLSAVIDWSWQLLSEPERIVLRRLAIHADGCTAEAAEAVAGRPDTLDLLTRLVDRSMVVAVHGERGPRYRLLESVAAYSLDRLRDAGELADVGRRHQDHCLALAEAAELRGPEQREWLLRLDAEVANLRLALQGAVADGRAEVALRLAYALTWYWYLRGRLAEAHRSLGEALSVDGGDPALIDRCAAWHAGMALLEGKDTRWRDLPASGPREAWFLAEAGSDLGDIEATEALLDKANAGFAEAGDRWGQACALLTKAKLAHIRGDVAALRAAAERSARAFGQIGDLWGELRANEWLAGHAEMTGDYRRAVRLHREALPIAESLDLGPEIAMRLAWLGWIAMQEGRFAEGVEQCTYALRMAREHGSRMVQTMAETGLGYAARRRGDLELAERHLGRLVDEARRQAVDGDVPLHLSMLLVESGFLAEQRGDAALARTLQLEAFDLAEKLDADRDRVGCLEGLAGACALAGDSGGAAELLGAAAALRKAMSLPPGPSEQAEIDRISAVVRASVGDLGFDLAYGHGQTLDAATAVRRRTSG